MVYTKLNYAVPPPSSPLRVSASLFKMKEVMVDVEDGDHLLSQGELLDLATRISKEWKVRLDLSPSLLREAFKKLKSKERKNPLLSLSLIFHVKSLSQMEVDSKHQDNLAKKLHHEKRVLCVKSPACLPYYGARLIWYGKKIVSTHIKFWTKIKFNFNSYRLISNIFPFSILLVVGALQVAYFYFQTIHLALVSEERRKFLWNIKVILFNIGFFVGHLNIILDEIFCKEI